VLSSTIKLGSRGVAIEVVVACVSELLKDDSLQCLSDQERRRVMAIRHQARREAVGASLALARLVVAPRLGLAPIRVPLSRYCARCGATDHGRPVVDGADFALSVSRSFGWAAVALAKEPVGIDIEPLNRAIRANDLRPVCTAAEQHWLQAVSHPEPLRLWVLKEAIGKAIGQGLVGAHRWCVPVETGSRLQGALSGTCAEGGVWSAELMPECAAPVVTAVATADATADATSAATSAATAAG
jgi:4'-phosphopantetheinyl transferase